MNIRYSLRIGPKDQPDSIQEGSCDELATGMAEKVGSYVIILERSPGRLLDKLIKEIQSLGKEEG